MNYKNFDEWFKYNCKGCNKIFGCLKFRDIDRNIIPFKCDLREGER